MGGLDQLLGVVGPILAGTESKIDLPLPVAPVLGQPVVGCIGWLPKVDALVFEIHQDPSQKRIGHSVLVASTFKGVEFQNVARVVNLSRLGIRIVNPQLVHLLLLNQVDHLRRSGLHPFIDEKSPLQAFEVEALIPKGPYGRLHQVGIVDPPWTRLGQGRPGGYPFHERIGIYDHGVKLGAASGRAGRVDIHGLAANSQAA